MAAPENSQFINTDHPGSEEFAVDGQFNSLDLLEHLGESGFRTTELVFVERALFPQFANLKQLREHEWSFMIMGDDELQTFTDGLDDLKVRIQTAVSELGLQTRWVVDKERHQLQVGGTMVGMEPVSEEVRDDREPNVDIQRTKAAPKGPKPAFDEEVLANAMSVVRELLFSTDYKDRKSTVVRFELAKRLFNGNELTAQRLFAHMIREGLVEEVAERGVFSIALGVGRRAVEAGITLPKEPFIATAKNNATSGAPPATETASAFETADVDDFDGFYELDDTLEARQYTSEIDKISDRELLDIIRASQLDMRPDEVLRKLPDTHLRHHKYFEDLSDRLFRLYKTGYLLRNNNIYDEYTINPDPETTRSAKQAIAFNGQLVYLDEKDIEFLKVFWENSQGLPITEMTWYLGEGEFTDKVAYDYMAKTIKKYFAHVGLVVKRRTGDEVLFFLSRNARQELAHLLASDDTE
jgi:hypothetical protein